MPTGCSSGGFGARYVSCPYTKKAKPTEIRANFERLRRNFHQQIRAGNLGKIGSPQGWID
jgi:hypothetical protein